MTIGIPDTLTTDNSEKYIMSIRLRPDGLSFSAYNPAEGQSFFFRDVAFDRSMPYAVALKELFFANECLTLTYRRTYILCVSPQYTLAPDAVFRDNRRDQFLSFNFSSPEKRCIVNSLKEEGAKLLFGIDEDIYEFCSRSTTNPIFTHHLTPALTMLRHQTREESTNRMHAIVHRKMVDIIRFEGSRLLFVNSFEFTETNDLLYYILYAWKQTDMNQLDDALLLSGDAVTCAKVSELLQTYIRHIGRLDIPAKAFLLGGEILKAPVDLMLLMSCE
ncbi:MAG: DUF3822 family protein [Tannerellaceae bacterium]|jgi:hypothetical protein|nr:DUF3822 family protein [Tannerellaceae bacterium]